MPLDADAQPLPRLRRGRPPKTAAERDEGNRRKDLIAAAARLFRSQGFDGTSTRDIAAAANMQSGSPFYFFQSKRAILHAVMQEGMARAIATLVRRRVVRSEAVVHRSQCSEALCADGSPALYRPAGSTRRAGRVAHEKKPRGAGLCRVRVQGFSAAGSC